MTCEIKKLCNKVINTRNISEFVGFCNSISSFTCDTLDPIIDCDMIEHIFRLFINDNILDKFDVTVFVLKQQLIRELKKVCLNTLSQLITSKSGANKFRTIIRTEVKLFNDQIQMFIDLSDHTYYVSVCTFIINLCIYNRKLVDKLNVKSVIGDAQFSCLDDKQEDILLKRIYCAYNYYNVGTDIKTMTLFVERFEQTKLSETIRINVCNLLYSSMKAMKCHALKDRVKKIENQ